MSALNGDAAHIKALRDFCEHLWAIADIVEARAHAVGLSVIPESCRGLGDSPDADLACEAYGDLQIALTDCAFMVDLLTDRLELDNDPVVREWQRRRNTLSTELPPGGRDRTINKTDRVNDE